MEASVLIAFAAVGLAAVMVPGPDFAIVTSNSLRHGRPAGLRTALGIAAGLVLWGLATALGLAAIVERSAVAFTAIKVVGGAYLLYLGIRALISARALGRSDAEAFEPIGSHEDRTHRGFLQGFLTNLLNPKAGLFYLTLLPQFAGANPTFADIAVLAVIQALIALTWFSLYAVMVSTIRPIMQKRRARQALEGVTGVTFVGVGLKLVLAR